MSVLEAVQPSAPSVSPAPTPADPVLVARLRGGDDQAFATIFRRYQAPLLSFCRHALGGSDDAEDALQQTFIRAHRALLSDSPPRDLRPWLYAIARNCCHSTAAARRPTAALGGDEPSLDGLSDEVAEREDLRELVLDLQSLPEDQRTALLLAELEDLSHPEIAEIVGCPVTKVKALIHQARATLIAQRDARAAPCQDIRMQLSVARGAELRRGPLKRHLNICDGCRAYAAAVRGQRASLALILPVAPTAGLAARVLGHSAAHAGPGTVGAAGGGHAAFAALASGGVSASAGAPAAAGATALLGGGIAAKLAVGGAVVVIASAGAATTIRHLTHHHPAPGAAALTTRPRRHPVATAAPGAAGPIARQRRRLRLQAAARNLAPGQVSARPATPAHAGPGHRRARRVAAATGTGARPGRVQTRRDGGFIHRLRSGPRHRAPTAPSTRRQPAGAPGRLRRPRPAAFKTARRNRARVRA